MRKHNVTDEEVELNLAAMLDMAFQLLAFFILTFHPPAVEAQVNVRMPKPEPLQVAGGEVKAGEDTTRTDKPKGLKTLVISAMGNEDGSFQGFRVQRTDSEDKKDFYTADAFEEGLTKILSNELNTFEQVIVQPNATLSCENMMKVVEICSKQKIYDPKQKKPVQLSKMSFVLADKKGSPAPTVEWPKETPK